MENNRKQEFWVGVFVLIGLALIAGMILQFGKFDRFFRPKKRIELVFDTVGGLVRKGNVLFAGVKVGQVTDIQLKTTGDRKVHVLIEIDKEIELRKDYTFAIRTSGMLGDQHIAIDPKPDSKADLVKDGEVIDGAEPVDFGAVADRLKGAVEKIETRILDTETLEALRGVIHNAKAATEKLNTKVLGDEQVAHWQAAMKGAEEAVTNVKGAADDLKKFTASAGPKLDAAVADFKQITEGANKFIASANRLVVDNKEKIDDFIKQMNLIAAKLNPIVARLDAGEGFLGKLTTSDSDGLFADLKKLVANLKEYGLFYSEEKARAREKRTKSSSSRPGLRQAP